MTPANKLDLTGQRFGALVVLHEGATRSGWRTTWTCRCDCGVTKAISRGSLRSGRVTSCGCQQGRRTHLMAGTRIYKLWAQMRNRCSNPNDPGWLLYGGRGITVCDRWRSFENFYADMGERPPGTSLDRMNNAGDYEPGNCRWATASEQARNKRSNIYLTHDGVTRTLTDWARAAGIRPSTFLGRYRRGLRPPVLFTGTEATG